jgi:hypothetical protein
MRALLVGLMLVLGCGDDKPKAGDSCTGRRELCVDGVSLICDGGKLVQVQDGPCSLPGAER